MFKVENAYFRREGREILHNVSLEVQEGEILSILGCNGAGKTTLIKCMMGFLKWSSGEGKLLGKPLHTYTTKQIWQYISYVPQAKGLVFDIKVLDMVALGLNPIVRFKPNDLHLALATRTLQSLNLAHLQNRSCFGLSGGELQMVLFARALVKSPKILILDEPESNLDFANQKIILETLKALAQSGCAIIFNTHFPANALFLSHKSLLLYKMDTHSMSESNALFGCAEDILTQHNLSTLYNVPICMDKAYSSDEFMLRI